MDEFEADFCRERCGALRRCGHICPEVCHADDDDAHCTGTVFSAGFLGPEYVSGSPVLYTGNANAA